MSFCKNFLCIYIRDKILNWKKTVDDEISSFSSFALTGDREKSTFREEHHGDIITGDLRLIISNINLEVV